MKRTAIAAVLLSLVFLAHAEVKDRAVVVQETEAVVTVTKVDREARIVTFRGPRGNLGTLTVPPESQNLDQVAIEMVAQAPAKKKPAAKEAK